MCTARSPTPPQSQIWCKVVENCRFLYDLAGHSERFRSFVPALRLPENCKGSDGAKLPTMEDLLKVTSSREVQAGWVCANGICVSGEIYKLVSTIIDAKLVARETIERWWWFEG